MVPTVEKPTKRQVILLIVGAIIVTMIVAMLTLTIFIFREDLIYSNIYIEEMDVGGLSKEEALNKISRRYDQQVKDININLFLNEYRKEISYQDIELTYLYGEALEKAYSVGRQGGLVNRLRDIYIAGKQGRNIYLQSHYNEELLDTIIGEIDSEISREAKDAEIYRKSGEFVIVKEEIGLQLRKDTLKEKIMKSLNNFNNEDIEIPVNLITPRIKEEDLGLINLVIGEFSTAFNPEMKGRNTNIAIAASKINSCLLMPGDEFSFNGRTGPTGVAEGYQDAPVIVNGELVPGVGGGVCQVSTTLYNAVIRSNLDIITRRNHSLSVAYVPLGHDAAVAYNSLDLKFRNSLSFPVYIESFVYGNRVYARLYGERKNDITVRLDTEILEVIEPNTEIIKSSQLALGEREIERGAKKGYRVNTYKVYLKDGKEIKREHISRDYYQPVHGKIIEGTGTYTGEGDLEIDQEEGEMVDGQNTEEIDVGSLTQDL